ncbi:MAG: glycosyltransferase family 9 protein [Sulfuricurvum sp.]
MAMPLHSQLRRKLRGFINKFLHTLFAPDVTDTAVSTNQIKNILIIRVNYRIGNILFTTPLINALAHDLPHAKIDMLIGAGITKPILEGFSSIGNVFVLQRKFLLHPIELFRFITAVRSQKYDLVINLNSASMSDQICTTLASATYKVGFYSDNGWAPLTHTMAEPSQELHTSLQPLKLMEFFSNASGEYKNHLDMNVTMKEKAKAKKTLETLIGNREHSYTLGIFRDARYEKKIEDSWWSEWYAALLREIPDLLVLDILSPEVPTPLNESVIPYSNKNLRELGALFGVLDLFVCGDTGPMHLAGASLVPTVALFKTTSPLIYGAIGENDISIVINDLSTQEVALHIIQHLKKVAHEQ